MIGKVLLPALVLTAAAVSPGQVSVRTRAFAFGKPVLDVRGAFLGEDGTAWLNTDARGTLTLTISNSGASTAHRTIVTLAPGGQLKDLQIVRTDSLGDIEPGESRKEKISVSVPPNVKSQKGAVAITVMAEPGHISAETKVEIDVREVPAPRLDITVAGAGAAPKRGKNPTITARVRNTGTADAHLVSATFLAAGPGKDPGIAEIGTTVPLGTIAQGSSKEMTLTLKPGKKATGPGVFVARLDEETMKFSVSETLSVPVNAAGRSAEQSGFEAYKNGDYNQAIASFESVVRGGKASKEVYYCLGFSYFKNRNAGQCLTNMQKSSRMGSPEAKTWIKENTVPVEIATVTYKQTGTDLFEGYTPPVGLGVLPFTDPPGHDTPITEKMYDALKAKNQKFRIFPYSTIRSAQVSWRLTALSPSNKQILNALETELSLNFALDGTANDSLGSAFRMRIIRCRDGKAVFTHEFRKSKSSTAVDDAAMMVLEGKVPVYATSRTLEVKLP